MNCTDKGVFLQSPLQQNMRFQQAESNTMKLSGAQEDLIWVCLHVSSNRSIPIKDLSKIRTCCTNIS